VLCLESEVTYHENTGRWELQGWAFVELFDVRFNNRLAAYNNPSLPDNLVLEYIVSTDTESVTTHEDGRATSVGGRCAFGRADQTLVTVCDGSTTTDYAEPIPSWLEIDGELPDITKSFVGGCHLLSDGTVRCHPSGDHHNINELSMSNLSAPFGIDSTHVQLDAESGSNTGFRSDLGTCALGDDGIVRCWNFDTESLSEFTSLVPSVRFSLGLSHVCALGMDGSLTCWGTYKTNDWEDYGIDYGYFRREWSDLLMEAPSGTFTQVDSGGDHACAIATDRTISCWGSDQYGQASPPSGTFKLLGIAGLKSCALSTDYQVVCWGLGFDEPTTLESRSASS